MRAVGLCVTALFAAGLQPAAAQLATGGVRLSTYAWSDAEAAGLESLSAVVAPWHASIRATPRTAISATGGFVRADASFPNGGSARTQGPTDTRIGIDAVFGGLTLGASASLPTGASPKNLNEARVVGLLASDLLPFTTLRRGSGFVFGGDIAYGMSSSKTFIELGAGFQSRGEAMPPSDVRTPYEPGSQVRLRAILERRVADAAIVSVMLGAQLLAADRFAGHAMMTSGDRLEAVVSWAFPLGARESGMLFASGYHRTEGEREYSQRVPTPIEILLPGSAIPTARTLFVAGGEATLIRGEWTLAPGANVRVLRSPSGVGQGWLSSLEVQAGYHGFGARIAQDLVVRPQLALRVGRTILHANSRSSMFAWEAGLSIQWLPAR